MTEAGEARADLLLVRLGREEEKERVKELLINELQFSPEDAQSAVDQSPTVIREAIPIGEARVVQSRLYPYIDILPRLDLSVQEPTPPRPATDPRAGAPGEAPPERRGPAPGPVAPAQPEDDGFEDGLAGVSLGAGYAATTDQPAAETVQSAQEPGPRQVGAQGPAPSGAEAPGAVEAEADDDMGIISSASEELRVTQRCHICGRTPVDGEKLAPCRTCDHLTCRDCFDRIAHVCSKCAEEGKTVDRPVHRRLPEEELAAARSAAYAARAAEVSRTVTEQKPEKSKTVPILVVCLLVVAVGAFVYFDPLELNLLGGSDGDGRTGPLPDTLGIGPDTIPAVDTTAIRPDTLSPDTLATIPDSLDPLGFRRCTLAFAFPEDLNPAPYLPEQLTNGVPDGLEVLEEELEYLIDQIALCSASVPITVDRLTLFRDEEGLVYVALSILHPEDDTQRYALLRTLGSYLTPSSVDELVLYYSESRYYPARAYTFVSSSFPDVAAAVGPLDFQAIAGTHDQRTMALLNGPVLEWVAALE